MTLSAKTAALTGPDRAEDAEVAVALGYRVVGEGHPIGTQCYDENGVSVPLPRFTSSLDAAMSVVPEGMRVRIDIMEDERGGAWVYWPTEMPTGMTELRATPALALLSAALAARGL